MDLVSMKTDDSAMCEVSAPSPYGYGLCLHLNDDQCEALGIKAPLAAGSSVMVMARAVVTRAIQSMEVDGDDKGPDVALELQITDMALKPGGRTSGEIASEMFPSEG